MSIANGAMTAPDKVVRNFECKRCGQTFRHAKALRKHGRWSCPKKKGAVVTRVEKIEPTNRIKEKVKSKKVKHRLQQTVKEPKLVKATLQCPNCDAHLAMT